MFAEVSPEFTKFFAESKFFAEGSLGFANFKGGGGLLPAPFVKHKKEGVLQSTFAFNFVLRLLAVLVVLVDPTAIQHAERALRLPLSLSLMIKSSSTNGSSFFDCNGAAPVVAVQAYFA